MNKYVYIIAPNYDNTRKDQQLNDYFVYPRNLVNSGSWFCIGTIRKISDRRQRSGYSWIAILPSGEQIDDTAFYTRNAVAEFLQKKENERIERVKNLL